MSALSRSAEPSWQPIDNVADQISGPPTLSLPEDWTLSTTWQRAQEETDAGGLITSPSVSSRSATVTTGTE
ncbi:hypothetical protein [Halapricum desulfuricans]|uniref:SWIM zinc finger protein n=1 Tax=Halapricum desulfuricans TaxID=2841257 RepID=A0A897NX28_9EURY|nr:hypothetical protein [Halapricum desulfuricans]QSG15169.1 SWIM zinc finger protein [Halapricum desulfuricans]